MALLTIEVSGRHARTRATTRDTVSAANRTDLRVSDASRDVARVVSDVSVLCPRFDALQGNSVRTSAAPSPSPMPSALLKVHARASSRSPPNREPVGRPASCGRSGRAAFDGIVAARITIPRRLGATRGAPRWARSPTSSPCIGLRSRGSIDTGKEGDAVSATVLYMSTPFDGFNEGLGNGLGEGGPLVRDR
jgi:hypothetical protein